MKTIKLNLTEDEIKDLDHIIYHGIARIEAITLGYNTITKEEIEDMAKLIEFSAKIRAKLKGCKKEVKNIYDCEASLYSRLIKDKIRNKEILLKKKISDKDFKK